jgi:diguanylate cyclase (GGDEF)-like protein
MPDKKDSIHFSIDEMELSRELETLRALLRGQSRGQALKTEANDGENNLLFVGRLVRNLSPRQWELLSRQGHASDWLAISLEEDHTAFLARIQDTLNQLALLAERDPLTNLPNRRAFDRHLELELQRAKRDGAQFSLAIIDLDNFKRINDTHGHPCGDDILKGLAEVMRRQSRSYDMAARIGGEEFALILPGSGMHTATVAVRRILTEFRELCFGCMNGEAVNTTFSAGLTTYRKPGKAGAPELLAMADRALYQAKDKGKNTVVTAPLPEVAFAHKATMVHSDEKKFLFSGTC